jgi:DNA-binding transcriptional LysR family regulator
VHRRLCAIFIPRFVARLHNEAVRSELRLLPLELPFGPIKRGVYLVKRESTPESKPLRAVAKALRQICAHTSP